MSALAVNSSRTIAELRELASLTSDDHGAQRVCWTPTWVAARQWLDDLLDSLPVETGTDAAANRWAVFPGATDTAVVIGSHLDSVPNGGWLDGALGVVAGLEVLRAVIAQGQPALTVKLVDWADEEGARFGSSTFGSSAVAGTLDSNAVRGLRDQAGNRFEDVASKHGVNFERLSDASGLLAGTRAYIELHIEQGPVLERANLPLAAVTGTLGVERHLARFIGQAAHAGSTPMEDRRDAFAAAARLGLFVRDQALQARTVATVGRCITLPGIPTAVAGDTEISLDQRHADRDELTRMVQQTRSMAVQIAEEEAVSVELSRIWGIDPIAFNPGLTDLVHDVLTTLTGSGHRVVSGPLHDAAQVARAGVPTTMIFVRSLRGISHAKEEDSTTADLELAVQALGATVGRLLSG